MSCFGGVWEQRVISIELFQLNTVNQTISLPKTLAIYRNKDKKPVHISKAALFYSQVTLFFDVCICCDFWGLVGLWCTQKVIHTSQRSISALPIFLLTDSALYLLCLWKSDDETDHAGTMYVANSRQTTYFQSVGCYSLKLYDLNVHNCQGRKWGGVWGGCHTPPIISTPGPSCNLMGRSRSRSEPVCIKFLFITPLADSSSVGAVTCYSKAALTYFLGRTDLISGYWIDPVLSHHPCCVLTTTTYFTYDIGWCDHHSQHDESINFGIYAMHPEIRRM